MYLRELQELLIDAARQRMHSGELTERRLARISGISQPHVHHVLNRRRSPSVDTVDRLMRAFGIRITDILFRDPTPDGPCQASSRYAAVPVLARHIGPGTGGLLGATTGFFPFPERLVRNLVDPVAGRLGSDPGLPASLAVGDLVLLDQNPGARSAPESGLWIVAGDAGCRARYLRRTSTDVRLTDEPSLSDVTQWRTIPPEGQNILEIVRARIVWIGRQMETEPAGPADPAGQSY